MPAILRLGDSLKAMLGKESEYAVAAGRTVRDTLIAMGIQPELVAMVSVAEEIQMKDYVIREGDVVRIMAVIGGG